MQKLFNLLLICAFCLTQSQTHIKDSDTKFPISYASISFGNGNGLVANDNGVFIFSKKLYPDIDSLFISALGYKDLKIATSELQSELYLKSEADELDEVVIDITISKPIDLNKKYKTESFKPYLDDDYYRCWLPTIESEIAVYFPNTGAKKLKRIAKVKFPIALESKNWEKRKRRNREKKSFSTLFKVNLYNSLNSKPHKNLNKKTIVFRATEKDGDYYELDISNLNIIMPDNGIFISLQVIGYTNKNGKLLPNKKYKEIKGSNGIIKIPTNFRPLLPFTDEITENRTFIKRVFINDNNWQAFKQNNGFKSSLLKAGLNNYGIGLDLHVFEN